jgi:hypothetical protein
VLHDRTWFGHILKAHPDMAPHRPLVEQTMGSPDEIRHSHADADCRIYFGPGPRTGVKIIVVVDVALGLVKNRSPGEDNLGRSRGMVQVDTIEGIVDDVLWCHYDFTNDVLYLQLVKHRGAATYSQETDDGMLLVRRQDNDELAGMTIVNWWKRFGKGALPDSIHELGQAIEPWAQRLAA